MNDILLESIRVIPVIIIFIYLLFSGRKFKQEKETGWLFIVLGFGLLLFGNIIDITDNFENLNKYVIIGDTEVEAFLEKVVGYLGGFVLLAIGFSIWLPSAVKLRQLQQELEMKVKERTNQLDIKNEELETKVKERTNQLNLKNKELEKTLEDFYTMRIGIQKDMELGQVEKENKKIKKRLDKLKKSKEQL